MMKGEASVGLLLVFLVANVLGAGLATINLSAGYVAYPQTPVYGVPTSDLAATLSVPTQNGVTFTPFATPPYITFTPSALVFNPGQTDQTLTFSYTVNSNAGNSVVYWNITGPDAHNYTVPAGSQNRSITGTMRTITCSTFPATVYVGVNSSWIRCSLDYSPSVSSPLVIVPNPVNGITFYPSTMTFTSTSPTIQLSFVPTTPGAFAISFSAGNNPNSNYLWYNLPGNQNINVLTRQFYFPTTYADLAPGVMSQVYTISIDFAPPTGVTIVLTDRDNVGITFYPSASLDFTPEITSLTFQFMSNAAGRIGYTLMGVDEDLYALPANPPAAFDVDNISIRPPAWAAMNCGDSSSYMISVTSLPPQPFTVSLYATAATFSPNTFTFVNGSASSFPVQVTANFQPQTAQPTTIVRYAVSGLSSYLVNTLNNGQFNIALKQITVPNLNNIVIGVPTPYVVSVNFPPSSDLTVVPNAPGITFSPSSFVFNNETLLSVSFIATASVSGSTLLSYLVSGTDAGCYGALAPVTVNVGTLGVLAPGLTNLPALPVGIQSGPITVTIPNLQGSVFLTPFGNGLTFTPAYLELTAAIPSDYFTYVGSTVGTQTIQFSVSGDSTLSVGNTPTGNAIIQQRSFLVPQFPTVYVQVPTDSLTVSLSYPPINDVSLRLWAPNTVFTPEILDFDGTTTTQTFTYVTSVAATNVPVSFFISGTDAALYSAPAGPFSFNSNLRPILRSAPINPSYKTKFIFTVSTLYLPPNSLTFTPVGAFTFTPTAQTIYNNGSGSVSFSAVPLTTGNTPLKVLIGGDSALYVGITDVAINIGQASFQVNVPATQLQLVMGVPSIPIYVYCSAPPTHDVSITFSSSQLIITPATLQFSPTNTVAQVTVLADDSYFSLNNGGTVNYIYTVSGTDAPYFQSGSRTLQVAVRNPYRRLAVSPTALSVQPGMETYFTVSLLDLPVNSLTVTPNADSNPFVTITPASAVFTPTSPTSVTFSLTTSFPTNVGSALDITVTGPDAYLFATSADNINVALTFPTGTITTKLPTAAQALQPTVVEFMDVSGLAPQSDLVVTPYVVSGPAVTFTPAALTFSLTTLSLRYSFTPSAPGTVVIGWDITGNDAAYYQLSAGDTDTVVVSGLNIYGFVANMFAGSDQLVVGVTSRTFTANVDVLPPTGVTIVPTSNELTFTPNELSFTPGQGAITFTVTPTLNTVSNQNTVAVSFQVTGTDSALYAVPPSFTTTIKPRTLTLNAPGQFYGNQPTQVSLTAQFPPPNGLTVTFAATGITFTPSEVTIAPGSSSVSVVATPTQSGITTVPVTIILGGADAGLYVTPALAPLSVLWGQINVPQTLQGGYIVSGSVTLQPAPPGTVEVTPVAANVIFTPPTLTFTPSVSSLSFSAVSTVPGPAHITYTLAGDAAPSYRIFGGSTAATITSFETLQLAVTSPTYTYVAGSVSRPFVITSQTEEGNTVAPAEPVVIVPRANFADAVFYPANVTIEAPANTATFTVVSNTIGNLVVSFEVATTGTSYAPMNFVSMVVSQRSFDIPAEDFFVNTALTPASSVFIFNVTSPQFTIFAKSVPANVTLTLISESFTFEPTNLFFDSATGAANFTMTPTAVGPAVISFLVSGPDANLFTVPSPHYDLRVTYQINLPVLPALSVGVPSELQTIFIYPVPTQAFILYLPAPSNAIVYTPSQLVFAAGTNSTTFRVTAYTTTIIAQNNAALVPGVPQSFTSTLNPIALQGREPGDFQPYQIPLSTPTSVNVMPGIFVLHHPRYQMNVQSHVDVALSVAPRSDIVITLYGNNLVFEPAHVTFRAGQTTKQSVKVTPLGATSYEVDSHGFKVNYICSGTNAQDYLCPSETLHYIALPRMYIAAAVLAPIGFLIICIIVAVVLYRRRRNGDYTAL